MIELNWRALIVEQEHCSAIYSNGRLHLATLGFSLLAAFTLSGCGGDPRGGGDPVGQELLDLFNERNPALPMATVVGYDDHLISVARSNSDSMSTSLIYDRDGATAFFCVEIMATPGCPEYPSAQVVADIGQLRVIDFTAHVAGGDKPLAEEISKARWLVWEPST